VEAAPEITLFTITKAIFLSTLAIVVAVYSRLFHKLQDAIRASKMTQVDIARLLGTDQSKVSKILRGKMSDFSMDRITSYLLKLRWDVRIEAHPAPAKATRGRALFDRPKTAAERTSKLKSRSAKRA
jgi:predicted XRE-type DNA-binding protein